MKYTFKRSVIAVAVLMTFASTAYASGDHDNEGTGNQTPTYNTTNQGGVGGSGGQGIGYGGTAQVKTTNTNTSQGGAGGSASVGNVGNVGNFSNVKNLSPEATANANSSNLNNNANTNSNTNANSNTNTNANSNKQAQGQVQGQSQSTKNSNNATQSTSVVVQGDNFEAARIPVSTAYAASMSPSAQCMGVATGGAQGIGFGISLGKSYESKPCNQRELARMFAQIGNTNAATQVLCSMEGSEVVSECQKAKPAAKTANVEAKSALQLDKTLKTVEKEAYTPVKSVPPTISSNGYHSVTTNPLAQ